MGLLGRAINKSGDTLTNRRKLARLSMCVFMCPDLSGGAPAYFYLQQRPPKEIFDGHFMHKDDNFYLFDFKGFLYWFYIKGPEIRRGMAVAIHWLAN
ncbi:hypothetical protein [Azotobacter beijerinckii]|uniref:hypothetical protein n=1 Tax=Azotobacter beijerinckii TaxID=170623 RepID=UPI001160CF18|nr:hypothetical protein [Azotobacter beijerinckii]